MITDAVGRRLKRPPDFPQGSVNLFERRAEVLLRLLAVEQARSLRGPRRRGHGRGGAEPRRRGLRARHRRGRRCSDGEGEVVDAR